MVIGDNRINNYEICRQIDDNFDHQATGAIQRDAHCTMERIHGLMQSH